MKEDYTKQKRIVIWGIGGKARKWLDKNQDMLTAIEIVSFIDSECKGDENTFYDIPVYSPSKLKDMVFDYLVIISSFFEEIKQDAKIKYEIDSSIIISQDELFQICFFDKYQSNWYVHLNSGESSPLKKRFVMSILKDPVIINKFSDYADYLYIKDNYCTQIEKKSYVKATEDSNVIWVCWLQGIENAPDLVQRCFASIEKHKGERELVLVTADTYKKYVSIPEDIEQLHDKGIITHTHFSDILRLELLANYGGLWMDATILCTGDIPSYIYDSEFFAYSFRVSDNEPRKISNWLLYAKKNCLLIEETLRIFYLILRQEGKMVNYFQMHYIFHSLEDIYRDLWDAVPYYVNTPAFLLEDSLNKSYDDMKMQYYKKMSPIHKLSYKISKDPTVSFSFYDYIISDLD